MQRGRAAQGRDKRDAERVLAVGELRGDMMVFQPMQVKDIGRGGLTIETLFPLQLDSLHDVRLTLGDSSVVTKGRVVHSRISSVDQDKVAYRSGLQLVDPSPSARHAIKAFLDALKEDTGGV